MASLIREEEELYLCVVSGSSEITSMLILQNDIMVICKK